MKFLKVFLVFCLVGLFISCSEISESTGYSKVNENYKYLDTDFSKNQYQNLISAFENDTSLKRAVISEENCDVSNAGNLSSFLNDEEFIDSLKNSDFFTDDLLSFIEKINQVSELEFDDFEVLVQKINYIEEEASRKLSSIESDYLFNYAESFKGGILAAVDGLFTEGAQSRSLFSKIFKRVKNIAISFAGGALLGGVIGAVSSGNWGVTIGAAGTTGVFSAIQSAKSGKIVIGIEFKL